MLGEVVDIELIDRKVGACADECAGAAHDRSKGQWHEQSAGAEAELAGPVVDDGQVHSHDGGVVHKRGHNRDGDHEPKAGSGSGFGSAQEFVCDAGCGSGLGEATGDDKEGCDHQDRGIGKACNRLDGIENSRDHDKRECAEHGCIGADAIGHECAHEQADHAQGVPCFPTHAILLVLAASCSSVDRAMYLALASCVWLQSSPAGLSWSRAFGQSI